MHTYPPPLLPPRHPAGRSHGRAGSPLWKTAGALTPHAGRTHRLWMLPDVVGRVTAEPVWAAVSSPHYDAAAMDGIAVRAADTAGATETSSGCR